MVKRPLSHSLFTSRRAVSLLLKVGLLAALGYFTPKFCAQQTDGFTLLKIQSQLTFDPRWETTPPKTDLSALLKQKFKYLNSGGQCYAFISEDEKLVIKFFKHHLRRVPWLIDHLPLPAKYAALREKQRQNRSQKLLRDFNSYKLSYEELPDETGLIYVHLNKTHNLGLKLTIVDKLNIQHQLELDGLEFVVQKRAELAMVHFQRLIDEQKTDEAKEAIDSLISIIVSRCQKGIYDEDPKLHRNLGFVGARAILIDVGRLRKDANRMSPDVYAGDVAMITEDLKTWLQKRSPELAVYLEEKVKELSL